MQYDPTTGQWTGTAPGAAPTINPAMAMGNPRLTDAKILAAQFNDWESTYKPVELNLIQQSSMGNAGVLPGAVDTATTSAGQTYDAMAGVEQRQLAARGIVASPEQQAVMTRLTGLSKAQAITAAANTARQQVSSNDEMIAMGSAPNPNIVRPGLQQQSGGA